MRRIRLTYPFAYHHVMNRGYDGRAIFRKDEYKAEFLKYLGQSVKIMKIRLFAYCVLDNHYHLILQNTSGRLSDFLKILNGRYGMYYRRKEGGKGYVFQSRFHSTLIENPSYLARSIIYLLQNPLRAGLSVTDHYYQWSSHSIYYSGRNSQLVDNTFVEKLFGSSEYLRELVNSAVWIEKYVQKTKYGDIMGRENFLKSAKQKHNRRKTPQQESIGVKRTKDKHFEEPEKILWEFERTERLKIEDINIHSCKGRKLRAKLLILLREKSGLTYKEIAKLSLFSDIKYDSLRSIYLRNKI